MSGQIANLKIISLAAEEDGSIFLEWQGKAFDSGSLTVELDDKETGTSAPTSKECVRYLPSCRLYRQNRTLSTECDV